jgi:hypothetical protein
MSSAILYLAIVAIWAVILVPLLLRRSHDGSGTAKGLSGQDAETVPGSHADGGAHPEAGVHAAAIHADSMAHVQGVSVEHGVAFEYDAAFEYGEVRSGGTVVSCESAAEYESAVEFDAVQDDRGAADDDAGSADDDETEPTLTLRGRALWSEGPGWHPLRRRDHRPRPVITRAAALRARRRMLTMLVTLTVVTLALVAESLAPAWMIVPPVGMLGILALLLHEAARADADADAAERRAEARAAHQARVTARQRAAHEAEFAAPERTAEIIDISARVSDQLYDQYADAAVRAVGD